MSGMKGERVCGGRKDRRWLAILAALYLLVWVNAFLPVVRLVPLGADEAAFATALIAVPTLVLIISMRLTQSWPARIMVGVLVVPVLLVSSAVGTLAGVEAV